MQERTRIGIIFNFSSGWLGGVYYIINIVNTLNFLEEEKKPEVFLFYNKELTRFTEEIDYPYLHKIIWQFTPVLKGYIFSWLTAKNAFVRRMIDAYKLDALYPVRDHPVAYGKSANDRIKLVSWFADLQHKYYPEFFSKKQLVMREARLQFMLRNTNDLVVSSKSVADDFKKFYKLRDSLKFHIYHFTSIMDNFDFSNISVLLKKCNIPEKYYLVSNQFHKHKNHKVLLEALAILKEKDINAHIAITGKFPAKSSSPYIIELYDLIETHQLHDNITFLGVISRHEQLTLMRYCQAIVQPSLFEGWSTVIEDAISIQTPVIASDLDVNIEQLGDKGTFFSPHDAMGLAQIIQENPVRSDFSKKLYEDYEVRVKKAAQKLIAIFE